MKISGLKSSRETLQDYLSHILESEIIFLIPGFSYSLKVQEKNPKKIYCLDNGLRRTAAFLFSKDIGRPAENPVFPELIRRGYEVHYWKNKLDGGSAWESNPPGTVLAPHTGFEVREPHQ